MARTLVKTIDIDAINNNIDTSVKESSKGYIYNLETEYVTISDFLTNSNK